MKQLNWYDKKNPDDSMYICGVPITPEAWIGGIVSDDSGKMLNVNSHDLESDEFNNEYVVIVCDDEIGYHFVIALIDDCCRPVYPPEGFGGLSESKLWEGMLHYGGGLYQDPASSAYINIDDWLWIDVAGNVTGLLFHSDGFDGFDAEKITDIEARILALQNASVLSKRLKEVKHAKR